MSPDTARGAQAVRVNESTAPFLGPLFGDTLIGFVPNSGDSATRFLGRLRQGYVTDTLNVLIYGDNRPAYPVAALHRNYEPIGQMFSLNPWKWVKGIVNIPILLVRGTIPDFKLWRTIPAVFRKRPTYGREKAVMDAMITKLDSLQAHGQTFAVALNSGDLVKDGRFAEQWTRFLRLARPLSNRVPYFAIAGNHERTEDSLGMINWHSATGLPVKGDRMYYCFDSADGWVRFLALDSNPLVDPQHRWSRDVEVKYSKEQIDWLTARLAEHTGPAIVLMHHPPFSLSYHRMEWQMDSVLVHRRQTMVDALVKAGLSAIVSGHEHAYERALLRCGDAVLIAMVSAGGGSPLNDIPVGPQVGQLFAEYKLRGCGFRPEDAFAAQVFHFVHMRIWFGGGEFFTYAVEKDGSYKLIDHVQIDLTRFGIPKVDQKKVPMLAKKGPTQPAEMHHMNASAGNPDTTRASKELLKKSPVKTTPARKPTPRSGR